MPASLTYDLLPSHSRLLQEYDGNGATDITITAAARDVDATIRWQARHQTVIGAAGWSAGILLVGMALAGPALLSNRSISFGPFLIALFAIFAAALFCLLWQVRYVTMLGSLESAMAQNTIVHANADRLFVESAGPLGAASIELPSRSIIKIAVAKKIPLEPAAGNYRLDCLRIERANEPLVLILPGHSEADLQWLARTLRSILNTPDVSV